MPWTGSLEQLRSCSQLSFLHIIATVVDTRLQRPLPFDPTLETETGLQKAENEHEHTGTRRRWCYCRRHQGRKPNCQIRLELGRPSACGNLHRSAL